MTPIVECRKVTKQYRQGETTVDALRGVDVTFNKGEFVSISGPSGSGKSTLLHIIGSLERPTSGEVVLDGASLSRESKRELADLRLNRIGFVFQAYNLIPVLSAAENVEFILQLQGVDAKARRARSTELLNEVGLGGLENRRPGQLSGGQQQRVAVARALASLSGHRSRRRAHRQSGFKQLRRAASHDVAAQRGVRCHFHRGYPRSPGDCAYPPPHRAHRRTDRHRRGQGRLMRLAAAAIVLLLAAPAHGTGLGGRIKLDAIGYRAAGNSLDAALGHQTSGELATQLRLNFTRDRGPWTLDAAWQIDARHGSAVARDSDIAASYPSAVFNGADDSYLDLDDTLVDRSATRASQRLDRLSLAYARGAFVTRIGRQALTWGSGAVFHPMDLVNPFQPVATDTAYKRGTDMAYGQWLMEDGSDVQLAVVPHRRDNAAGPDSGKATFAAFANITGQLVQWSLLLASDRSDSVLGVGASGALGGAVWNAEVIPTWTVSAGTRTSALANLSYATTLLERNTTLFVELYHNGFGESGSDYTATDLGPDLAARLVARSGLRHRARLLVAGCDLGMEPAAAVDAHADLQCARSQRPARSAAHQVARQRRRPQGRRASSRRCEGIGVQRLADRADVRSLSCRACPGFHSPGILLLNRGSR